MKKLLILFVIFLSFSVITAKAQNWDQVIKACASDRSDGSLYGHSVAISGDYAIVGALGEDFDVDGLNRRENAGAAYILKNIGGVWTEVQKIVASDRTNFDYFGYSVAISGDYAIVGANMEDEDALGANYAVNSGSVYVFHNNSGVWIETQKLVSSDREKDDYFGSSVSICGDVAIVGAYLEDEDVTGSDSLPNAGAAYIFINNSGTWVQSQKIVASDRSGADYFGRSVSIDGDYAIIGAYAEDEDALGGETHQEAGSAYIFKSTAGTWSQIQKIVASDRAETDYFGFSVSISGNHAIVGAYNEDEDETGAATLTEAGSAYIFENIADVWTQVSKIANSDREASDQFGYSVSISGDYAVVGANLESEDVFQLNHMHTAGSAYVYKNVAGDWIETQKIVPQDRQTGDLFGAAVAISGNTIISGALQQDYDQDGGGVVKLEAGSVYIFEQAVKNITVKQDIIFIPNGSTFQMEGVIAGNSSGPIVFTIENNGLAELNLTGDPKIIISGMDSPYFVLDQTAVTSPVASLASTFFTISFDPDAARDYFVQVSILNDVDDDNPYVFILNATGNKIPQTIFDFDDISVYTYGDDPFQVSASATSGLDVVFSSSDPSVAVCSGINGTTVTILSAGVCDILANQPGDILWDVAPQVAKTLVVDTKTITVNAHEKTKIYGDADPEFTYSYTPGLISDDSFSGSLTRIAGEDANTSYQIQQGTLTLGANYTIIYNPEELTINPRPITVTAGAGQTKIYWTPDPASYVYSVTDGNLVWSDVFTGALTREAGENVGFYEIQQGTLAISSNYLITFVEDYFEITPKSITVTVDPGQSKTYGLPDPDSYYYTFTDPIIGGNNFSGTLSREEGEDVGFYTITIGTLTLGENYTINLVTDNFEITQQDITVVVYANQYKSYGQTDPDFIYWITGVLVSGDSFSGALGREEGEAVGFYQIQPGTLTAGPNYNLSFTLAYFEIKVTSIVVIVDPNQTKVYGEDDPETFSYSYYGTLAGGDSFTGALVRAGGENFGHYPVTQGSLALNSNYNLSFISDDFEITKRPVTVTPDDGQYKIYGDDDPAFFTYSVTEGSLVGDDYFSGSLYRYVGENVGFYTIHQGTLTLSSNYSLTCLTNSFEIIAVPVTVIADANQTKVYGDTDPVYTYHYTGNILSGDDFYGELSRIEGEDIGLYAIQQGTLSLGSNYEIIFNSDNFEITLKPVVVTADPDQSKIFGQDDPVFTYSVSPDLVDGDNFTGSLTREQGEDVGFYEILQGDLALNSNYELSFVGADFEIEEIPIITITVIVDPNQSKIYGEADPEFTYTYSGTLEPGDSFTGALTRDAGENAGLYAIQQGTLQLGENYNLVFVSNDFEIIKATPAIDWENPADIYYGTLLSSTQLNAFAGIAGSYEYNPPAGTLLSDGNNQELNVTFTPTDNLNYNVAYKTVYINVLWTVKVGDVNINAMSFYPNPTTGIVNFDGNKAENIRITDITGKLVFEKSEFMSGESIDLSMNPAGVYFVTVQTGGKVYTTRIVLQ